MAILKLNRTALGSEVIEALGKVAREMGGNVAYTERQGHCISLDISTLPALEGRRLEIGVVGSIVGMHIRPTRNYRALGVYGMVQDGQWGRSVDLERDVTARPLYDQFSRSLNAALTTSS